MNIPEPIATAIIALVVAILSWLFGFKIGKRKNG